MKFLFFKFVFYEILIIIVSIEFYKAVIEFVNDDNFVFLPIFNLFFFKNSYTDYSV